ncbi:MAG: hypothetical protein IPM50_01535 [Acidobacteriota bacterium]|nr:MAG: hypothetical protein IPM50_01535 [Acidobacteriota bacterium]
MSQLEQAFAGLEQSIEAALTNHRNDPVSVTQDGIAISPTAKVIRSAAVLEQALGGISRRLWDDPFEWTLPEAFPTDKQAFEYLSEVRSLRRSTFAAFKHNDDLDRLIPSPIEMRSIRDVLLDALTRSRAILDCL